MAPFPWSGIGVARESNRYAEVRMKTDGPEIVQFFAIPVFLRVSLAFEIRDIPWENP
jgi:hypothetical protein